MSQAGYIINQAIIVMSYIGLSFDTALTIEQCRYTISDQMQENLKKLSTTLKKYKCILLTISKNNFGKSGTKFHYYFKDLG